jgi:hypothetical protein
MPFGRQYDDTKAGWRESAPGIAAIIVGCVFTVLVIRCMWLARGAADYLKISSFVILAQIAIAIGISSLSKRRNR